METDQLPTASDFRPLEGEANFGPPIQREVRGGVHIAPECVVVRDGKLVMIEWPTGLPRHDTERAVRFPHGLMMFGETLEQCGERLTRDQMGFKIDNIRVLYVYSYVDSASHWHLEPLLLIKVSGEAAPPTGSGKLIEFLGPDLPEGAVWSAASFNDAYANYISPHL